MIKKKSRYIKADDRFKVLTESDGICPLCGGISDKAEWDHKTPFSIVPINDSWNIQICCKECNRKKGNSMQYKYNLDFSTNRDYQNDAIKALEKYPFFPMVGDHWYQEIGRQMAALVYLGTSSGKSRTMLMTAFNFLNLGDKKGIIVCPGNKTIQRICYEYVSLKEKGIIKSGTTHLPAKLPALDGESTRQADFSIAIKQEPLIVFGAQYAINRTKSNRDFFESLDFLILEEGHHTAAERWSTIVDACPNAKVMYWSGTPARSDKVKLPKVPYKKEFLYDN